MWTRELFVYKTIVIDHFGAMRTEKLFKKRKKFYVHLKQNQHITIHVNAFHYRHTL